MAIVTGRRVGLFFPRYTQPGYYGEGTVDVCQARGLFVVLLSLKTSVHGSFMQVHDHGLWDVKKSF